MLKSNSLQFKPTGRGERGATVVEVALSFTVFMMLMLGLLDVMWRFINHNNVQHALDSGARLAQLGNSDLTVVQSKINNQLHILNNGVSTFTLYACKDYNRACGTHETIFTRDTVYTLVMQYNFPGFFAQFFDFASTQMENTASVKIER